MALSSRKHPIPILVAGRFHVVLSKVWDRGEHDGDAAVRLMIKALGKDEQTE